MKIAKNFFIFFPERAKNIKIYLIFCKMEAKLKRIREFSCFLCVILFTWFLGGAKAEYSADVIAISQGIYDIYIQLDDRKLRDIISPLGISKGGYKRIDTAELEVIMKKLPAISKKHAGGAAANTLAGISSLGGTSKFIGVLADDNFGKAFLDDMHQANVQTNCFIRRTDEGKGTALVILLITPDGERTMLSYLGVSVPINYEQVDQVPLYNHRILFSDAYIWDNDLTSEMLRKTYAKARKNNVVTSFGLGNASVVRIYREKLLDFLKDVDIIFGNLSEYQALYDMESIESIIQQLQKTSNIAILTNAEHGALIITSHAILHAPAKEVMQIVDTTGAGDMFAAGFLYGMTHGYDLDQCGKIASEMAGHIIAMVGARPTGSMSEVLRAVS